MILPIFPILLLLTALGSVFLYQCTDLDIFKVLAVGTAIICLVWGLVIAHWSIHLLSLIVLLKFKSPVLKTVQVQTNK